MYLNHFSTLTLFSLLSKPVSATTDHIIHDRAYPLPRTYYPMYQELFLIFNYEGEISEGRTKICLDHIDGAEYEHFKISQGEGLIIDNIVVKSNCDKPEKYWGNIEYKTSRDYQDTWRGELDIKLDLSRKAVMPEQIALYIDFHVKHKVMDVKKNGVYVIGSRYDVGVHFLPAYARESFPCFDDPYFRTNFTLKIGLQGYPKYQNRVLSNVPHKFQGMESGIHIYRYGNLPYTLPSYLLSFALLREGVFDIVLSLNYFKIKK